MQKTGMQKWNTVTLLIKYNSFAQKIEVAQNGQRHILVLKILKLEKFCKWPQVSVQANNRTNAQTP